jgi:queuosine precursor transporter
LIWLIGYVLSIVAANATLALVGLVPVGFGLLAPAGVLWAGVALTLRDVIQERLGRRAVFGAVVAGAVLSSAFAPSFAVASGGAFLASELADFAVYTPIRRRHWLTAVAASNTVGLLIDSGLFLWLAFGSFDFLAGLIVGKLYVTIATIVVLRTWRQHRHVLAGYPSA